MRISDWSSDVCSSDLPTALQAAQQGTADAVRAAAEHLTGMRRGTILILYGDTPLIATATLRRMLARRARGDAIVVRSEEHTSELQSLMRISYAVVCLKKNTKRQHKQLRKGTSKKE